MEIKFQYTVKKPNGHIFSETFQLRDIERGYVSSWLKNNSVGVTSEIFKRQYTGLKDKNGKEIYEGDIVDTAGGSIKEIVYIADCWGSGFQMRKADGQLFSMSDISKFVEVIGNIHENPELLSTDKI